LADLASPIRNPVLARLADKFDDLEKLATSWTHHRTVCFRSSSQHVPAILMDDFSSVAHHHAF
ncbi:hypothetical protein P0D88_54270, partial [Paraburkholderia sp. RL18-103-BIB-C]|uniref:hypothetical protein n=1 Tax=Paraburkholderia sp. RL18-103-BIB-C TaxID=3031637 RepID=UPI0038BCC34B